MAEDKKDKKVKTDDEAADDATMGDGGRKKKLLIFGITGLVATAGIGGGTFYFLGKGNDKGEHSGSETAAPAHEEKAAEGGHGEAKAEDPKTEQGKAAPATAAEGAKDDKKGGHGENAGPGEKTVASAAKDVEEDDNSGIDFGQTFIFAPFHMNLGNPLENRYVRLEISVEYKVGAQKAEIERRLPQLRDAIVSIASRKTREFLLAPDGKDQLRKEIKTRLNRYMTKPIEAVYITDILIE